MGIQWIEGVFLARPNRFVAEVQIDGKVERAHVPNTGRLQELLIPGVAIALAIHLDPKRKYRLSLRQVKYRGIWVSIDSQLPNRLVKEALETGLIFPNEKWGRIQSEASCGESRFDFALHGPRGIRWLEVKGVTLEREEWGYFPDAPTTRGTRHVRHLQRLVEAGQEAAVIFVIQNAWAKGITPNLEKDPEFAQAVREACEAGVQFFAYCWGFEHGETSFFGARPVEINRV
ncbi:DNA/RNA nuclease SfsA [Gottschalkiaceae bacterium SANA]|nr:DNA/RNA nuclease SfsA [Gottschalkiaceae bacterium SANA]